MNCFFNLVIAALCGTAISARQSSQVLVDLGGNDFLSNGTQAETWNDVTATNMATPFELLDTVGVASGIDWKLTGLLFTGSDDSFEVSTAGGLNLLFYGNSYSQFNSGVPSLAGFIAEEAGFPSPKVVAQLVAVKTCTFTSPIQFKRLQLLTLCHWDNNGTTLSCRANPSKPPANTEIRRPFAPTLWPY